MNHTPRATARALAASILVALGLSGCAELGLPTAQGSPGTQRTDSRAAARPQVQTTEPTDRRRGVPPAVAPASCAAPEVLATSLALLPDAERAALQQTLDAGSTVAGQRARWRTEVKQAELDSTRLYMPNPGFGCNNPGLGAAKDLPGRSDPRSLWANSDCAAEAKPGSSRGLPASSPAMQQARNGVTAQITRLKAEDPELVRREQDLALALGQHLQRAVQQWSQAPAASFGLQELAAMETLRTQVVAQCTTQQGRATAASEAQVQQATAAMLPVFDKVLALRADTAAAELGQAKSRAALQAGVARLFPSPLLEQRARAQPPIAAALNREGARVAALDAQADREKEARLAALNKKLSEQTPEFLARKRAKENVTANAAPTNDDVQALVIDYLIADRYQKVGTFERRNGNQMRLLITLPVVGTMQAYLAEVTLQNLRCTPAARKQMCELEYTERTMAGADSYYAPPGDINRKHRAEFSWSEEGLQSAGLKADIVAAHKSWHARVNEALRKKLDAQSARDGCKDRLGSNASDKTVSKVCGW